MDIKNVQAARVYADAKLAAPVGSAGSSAEDAGAEFLQSLMGTLQRGEDTARAAMTGNADPHALVEALASSQTAVETVVTVRDRVVEAYQEILRMPV